MQVHPSLLGEPSPIGPVSQPQVASAVSNQIKDTAEATSNASLGLMVEALGSQSADIVTALTALAAAINAKPAA